MPVNIFTPFSGVNACRPKSPCCTDAPTSFQGIWVEGRYVYAFVLPGGIDVGVAHPQGGGLLESGAPQWCPDYSPLYCTFRRTPTGPHEMASTLPPRRRACRRPPPRATHTHTHTGGLPAWVNSSTATSSFPRLTVAPRVPKTVLIAPLWRFARRSAWPAMANATAMPTTRRQNTRGRANSVMRRERHAKRYAALAKQKRNVCHKIWSAQCV